MILFAGIALALVVVALLRGGASNEEIVSRLSRQSDPRIVAAAAEVLAGRGMSLTAEALRMRAQKLATGAVGATGATPIAAVAGQSTNLRSPFMAASDEAWTDFVRLLAVQLQTARSPNGRLGRFDTHLKRLQDIGWVHGLGRGDDGSITAVWVAPLTEERFLADPWVQYRALVATLKHARRQLNEQGVAASGARTNGASPAISLSGLLAVAHRLGAEGAVKWLRSPTERARQRIATALFKSANGLF